MRDFQIRRMQAHHWSQVVAIYRQGIAGGNATFETRAPGWERWHESHLVDCRLVAVRGDDIVGWAALSPVSRRDVYRGVAEVSVYVAQASRRQGIGKTLLDALIQCAEEAGVWTLQASMFPENEASVALHLACGFRIVGRREKIAQHHGVWRDTLLLERRSHRVGT